jgi:hypothetical protein
MALNRKTAQYWMMVVHLVLLPALWIGVGPEHRIREATVHRDG